jgi:predicted O-methyltransferase YrrM
MGSREKLARFARKPLHDKWAATKATIGELSKELRVALMHMRAARIEFHSGLGNAGHVLYGLVRSMRPDVCVEIGSARGKSACYIGMALKENRRGRLYAIDPHCPTAWNDVDIDTAEYFRTNISKLGLSEQVIMIRSTSEEAAREWQRPIDLIFIDGDHSYSGAKRDWELFAPHVRPFGIVVFHDTMWELMWELPPWREYFRADMGVPRLVDELREQGFQVLTIDQDCGVSIVQPVVGGCPLRNTPPTDAAEHSQPAGSVL